MPRHVERTGEPAEAERRASRCRRTAARELDGEQHDQHQPEPEAGHGGEAAMPASTTALSRAAAGAQSRERAEHAAECEREGDERAHQQHRGREPLEDQRRNRLVVEERMAEIECRHLRQMTASCTAAAGRARTRRARKRRSPDRRRPARSAARRRRRPAPGAAAGSWRQDDKDSRDRLDEATPKQNERAHFSVLPTTREPQRRNGGGDSASNYAHA